LLVLLGRLGGGTGRHAGLKIP
ncbi:MAG: hypothetical protein RL045_1673, partial [Bacteroidota bacterium]